MRVHKSKKTSCAWKNICISIPCTCNCENVKYLKSTIDNSVIACDDAIEATETVPLKTVLTNTIATKTLPRKIVSTKAILIKLFLNFSKTPVTLK